MNMLTSYTLRYLRLNRKRTAATILGVILSSALICGVFLLGLSFQKVMIEHEIFMAGNWHARFPAVPFAKAKTLAENHLVQIAMLSQPLGVATYGSHNKVRPYLYLTAYDPDSFQHQSIRLITGRLPQKADELLISPLMIKDSGLDLQAGATVQLTFGRRNIPDYAEKVKAWGGEAYVALDDGENFIPTVTKTYTVVGLMAPLADETSMLAAFPAFTYLDQAQLTATTAVDVAILAHNPSSINSDAPAIAKAADLSIISASATPNISYNERLLPWLGASGQSTYVRFFVIIRATLITLIVGGSALVIYNAFAISIGERKRQFGMFASVGASAAQIRRIVLTEALVIAAIGIPLGILGAIAGVSVLLQLTRGIVSQLILDAEQGMTLVLSPLVLGLTGLFSIVTILLAAWVPARRASQISPIAAIRQSEAIQTAKPLNLRTSPLIRRVFGIEAELALKSLKRDHKKYVTTVLSLMISIVLFVAFNALMLYTTTINRKASQAMNFDLIIDLDYRQSHAKNFADLVSQLPEVQRVTYKRCTYQPYIPSREVITDQAYQALNDLTALKFENLPRAVDGGTFQFVLEVCAVGPSEFAHYLAQLGLDPAQYSDPAAPRGILLNHTSLRQGGKLYDFDLFNLKSGDSITVSAQPGSVAPTSLTWTVGAVTQATPVGFMGITLVADLFVSDAVFDGLSEQLLQLGPINPGAMYVQSDNPAAALAAIERLYTTTIGGNFAYYAVDQLNNSSNLQQLLIKICFYGFLTLITLIGVINIINTLDTNIKLRRREIAMLKSVGLTPAGFRRMLRYESLFYGLTALMYGLPLGIALSGFIYYQFGDGVGTFAFTLPWAAIAVCVLGTLALVFATMLISGAMIRNDPIVDTIKAENI